MATMTDLVLKEQESKASRYKKKQKAAQLTATLLRGGDTTPSKACKWFADYQKKKL